MMRALLCAAAALVAGTAVGAQTPTPAPAVAVDDGATIDTLIAELYAVISGPAGPRDWGRFTALFVPEGRLVAVGDNGPRAMTPQGYIERVTARIAKEGFFETEAARRTERYGNIAHVFSTYESRLTPGAKPFARGINSIQLVRIAGRWRILSLSWQGETPYFALPNAYLPTRPAQ